MEFIDSPFLTEVFDLVGDIIATGSFLFRALFYSIKDWLNLYPENWIFTWVAKITDLLGLDGLINQSFVDLMFTREGIWTIITLLVIYFFIP